MKGATLPALLASMIPLAPHAPARAEVGADSPFITYYYGTVLVPRPGESETVIPKRGLWFTGNALPSRLGRLQTSVAISGTEIVLPAGQLLGLAKGPKLIGCTKEANIKFRLGRSRVCLIDMDGDGDFDSWFRRAGGLTFYPYSSRVSRDDIHPTGKVAVKRISEREFADLEIWDDFWAKIDGSKLTFCAWGGACSPEGVRIEPSLEVQQVQFMGGEFDYQLTADKKLRIRVRKPPGITYLG